MNKNLIYLFFILVLTSFVYSAPAIKDISVSGVDGIIIEPLTFQYYPYGEDIGFDWHIYNASNGFPLTNKTVSCIFHLYNNVGDHIYINNSPNFELGRDFEVNLYKELFELNQVYSYFIDCNNTHKGGGYTAGFEITTNANPNNDNKKFEILLGIAIIIGTLFIMIQQLDKVHIILKVLFYFIIITFVSVIPNIFLINTPVILIQDLTLKLYTMFWIYVGVFIIYWIITKVSEWINNKKENEDDNNN